MGAGTRRDSAPLCHPPDSAIRFPVQRGVTSASPRRRDAQLRKRQWRCNTGRNEKALKGINKTFGCEVAAEDSLNLNLGRKPWSIFEISEV